MIAPDVVAAVRERADIVAIVSESVPSLKRRGRSFVGLCPFHKEKTPSFHVNPERGFFHCFGCKESGSVLDFVMKQDGLTFPEAVRALADRVGIEIREERVVRSDEERKRRQREDLYAVNQVAATFYEKMLREHPQRSLAISELARRGLVPSWARADGDDPAWADAAQTDATLSAFRVGYAPPGWDGLASYLRVNGIAPSAAEALGLLVPRSSGTGHYDRFRNRLMFAVVDVQGRIIAWSGRALPEPPGAPPPADGQKPAKYINSPESPIYSKGQALFGIHQAKAAIRQQGLAVLVEGNFDVVSLHARGFDHVVAPLGTAFTDDQARLLKRFTESVVLLFDPDAAGRKATRAARGPCRSAGLTARVANLPAGVDPDELARSRGIEAVSAAVSSARGMLEYLIQEALDATFTSADAHERAARVEQVARLLTEEDDPLVRSMAKAYADELAGRLDLVRSPDAFRALEAAVKRALTQAARPLASSQGGTNAAASKAPPSRARIAPRPKGSAERREIVGAIIECPALLDDDEVQRELELLEGASAHTVAAVSKACKAGPNGEKNLDSTEFLAQIPQAIHPFASERLAAPRHDSPDQAKRSLLENARKLRRLVLSRETTDFAREQHRVAGDWEAETELAREASERARLKHGLTKHSGE